MHTDLLAHAQTRRLDASHDTTKGPFLHTGQPYVVDEAVKLLLLAAEGDVLWGGLQLV